MNIGQLSKRFSVTGQITAGDLSAIAAQGFKSIVNNRPDNEEPNQPMSDDLASAAADLGLNYVYVPVVSGRITQQDVDDFNRACNDLQGPILLFCRSGARCTVLWQLSAQD
jgi:sulfide:quinone oxidoreductase